MGGGGEEAIPLPHSVSEGLLNGCCTFIYTCPNSGMAAGACGFYSLLCATDATMRAIAQRGCTNAT